MLAERVCDAVESERGRYRQAVVQAVDRQKGAPVSNGAPSVTYQESDTTGSQSAQGALEN